METKSLKSRSILLSALLALSTPFAIPTLTRAADHGDAPSLAHDQACDIADNFFFRDPNDNSKVIFIGTVHGFIVPGEAANFAIFDHVVRYRFEIERDGNAAPDKFIDVTFSKRVADLGPAPRQALQIPRAQTATITIPKLTGFPGGTFTAPVLNPSLAGAPNTPTASPLGSSGIQFFAGEVDDPFFFDIPGFARFIASVRAGAPNPAVFNRGRDSFGGYNVLAIALSIPVSMLVQSNPIIGMRSLTQRRTIETPNSKGTTTSIGAFKTVDSSGIPAVNVALIPFNRKNAYNAAPAAKLSKNQFAGDILSTLAALGTNGTTDLTGNTLILAQVAVVLGDYLRLDTRIPNLPTDRVGGGAPLEGSGFPNGRRLRDDTVDILLSFIANGDPNLILAGQYNLGDNVDADISQFPQQSVFPFLAPAQQPVDSVDPNNPTATDDRTQN